MFERAILVLVAVGPIALLLVGIAVVGVGVAWGVTKVWGRVTKR